MLLYFGRKLKEIHEVKRDERGFTLIELLVVVIIIGVLAAIAIPAYLAQREDAQQAVVNADARQAGTAINSCLLEVGTSAGCDTPAELDPFGYNISNNVQGWTGTAIADVDPVTAGNQPGVESTHTHSVNTAINAVYNSGTGQVTP